MEMDFEILCELSDDEIESFRDFYKNLNSREFVYVHLYLKTQFLWNKKIAKMSDVDEMVISDRCKAKFYRHIRGREENKTLIGITQEKDYTIFVMTLDESLVELRDCLMETKLINWMMLPLFVAVHRRFNKLMYEIFESKNLRVRVDNYCSTIWMDKTKAASYQFTTPNNVEMRNLSVNDGKMINDVWPYRYFESEKFIRSLIHLNCGLGIYEDGKLVSWILQIECFGLGLLQTLENHQGKGYAKLLTRAMSKKIAVDDVEDVILFASYGKPKTVDLYIRLGFQHASFTHWMYLKQNDH